MTPSLTRVTSRARRLHQSRTAGNVKPRRRNHERPLRGTLYPCSPDGAWAATLGLAGPDWRGSVRTSAAGPRHGACVGGAHGEAAAREQPDGGAPDGAQSVARAAVSDRGDLGPPTYGDE